MAVKKASTPKTSSTPKAASTKKTTATTKTTTTKKAPAAKKAPAKKAPAKKAAATKTGAVKLSDAQTRVLAAVQQASEAGYAPGKGEAKVLEALLKKKLIKRGKKVDGTARYLATKAGAKHVPPTPAPSIPSAPAAPDASVTPSVSAPA